MRWRKLAAGFLFAPFLTALLNFAYAEIAIGIGTNFTWRFSTGFDPRSWGVLLRDSLLDGYASILLIGLPALFAVRRVHRVNLAWCLVCGIFLNALRGVVARDGLQEVAADVLFGAIGGWVFWRIAIVGNPSAAQIPNQDQIEFWNEEAGQNWVALQERMDVNLSGIHAALMAFAAPAPGMAILDVGCGTGTTSLALARIAGAGGKVCGVDISAPMLEMAQRRAKQADLAIAFRKKDAGVGRLRTGHDLVFSRFGVMFFDDPVAAFTNLRRALKPGGRLAFVCWRTPAENPWASAPLVAARPFLSEQPPSNPLAPGPFAFADADRVRDILAKAGFSDIEIRPENGVMPMGRDLDEVAAQTLRIGPLSRAAGGANKAARALIVEAVKAKLETFREAGGEVAPPTACWLVGARSG